MNRLGIVLTGGGARAAYQAGALKALLELAPKNVCPFGVISGASAGAINGAYLAANAKNPLEAMENLCQLWENLSWDQVVSTSSLSYLKLGGALLRDLGLGGVLKEVSSTHLFDNAPLKSLLEKHVNFSQIQKNILDGQLHAFSVTATNYKTGTSVSFFDGNPEIEDWCRTARMSVRSAINGSHILASASIPILFPPVKIEPSFYCDGLVRLRAPLSPAIHTGAEKVVAVGIRARRTIEEVRALNKQSMDKVSIADIAGTLLNASFLDALDSDVDRVERINRTLSTRSTPPDLSPDGLKAIPILCLQPSKDLGTLAASQFSKFPRVLRHLLGGLGASQGRGLELLSYLSFDSSYTRPLVALGFQDTVNRKAEIQEFLDW